MSTPIEPKPMFRERHLSRRERLIAPALDFFSSFDRFSLSIFVAVACLFGLVAWGIGFVERNDARRDLFIKSTPAQTVNGIVREKRMVGGVISKYGTGPATIQFRIDMPERSIWSSQIMDENWRDIKVGDSLAVTFH